VHLRPGLQLPIRLEPPFVFPRIFVMSSTCIDGTESEAYTDEEVRIKPTGAFPSQGAFDSRSYRGLFVGRLNRSREHGPASQFFDSLRHCCSRNAGRNVLLIRLLQRDGAMLGRRRSMAMRTNPCQVYEKLWIYFAISRRRRSIFSIHFP